MSEAVLVMDMPSSCSECNFQQYGVCHAVRKSIVGTPTDLKRKPDWCPLRELPEKKDSMNLNSIMEKCKDRDSIMDSVLKQFIVDGYNSCINELLEDKE